MCRNIIGYLLICVFVFVVSTIAAFVYLPWWQALAVSFLVFFGLITLSKFLLKFFVRRLGRNAFQQFFEQSKALQNATIQVHAISPTAMPGELNTELKMLKASDDDEMKDEVDELESRRWFRIEASIFPDSKNPNAKNDWIPTTLQLVPFEAKPIDYQKMLNEQNEHDSDAFPEDDSNAFDLHDVVIVENGVDQVNLNPEEPLQGPQRLKMTVGVPSNIRLLKFRYTINDFGRIELPVIFKK